MINPLIEEYKGFRIKVFIKVKKSVSHGMHWTITTTRAIVSKNSINVYDRPYFLSYQNCVIKDVKEKIDRGEIK